MLARLAGAERVARDVRATTRLVGLCGNLPLAVGIEREIREGLREERVPSARLGRALHYWTHGPRYLAAVAAGQRRRHLDEQHHPDHQQHDRQQRGQLAQFERRERDLRSSQSGHDQQHDYCRQRQ